MVSAVRPDVYDAVATVLKAMPALPMGDATPFYKLVQGALARAGVKDGGHVVAELVGVLAAGKENQEFFQQMVQRASREELADLFRCQMEGPDPWLP